MAGEHELAVYLWWRCLFEMLMLQSGCFVSLSVQFAKEQQQQQQQAFLHNKAEQLP